MKNLLVGILGIGLCCGPALWAQSQDQPKKAQPHEQQMSADMREAIAFERGKDAADARQARLEARHPSVPVPDDQHTANRAEKEPTSGDTGAGQVKHKP